MTFFAAAKLVTEVFTLWRSLGVSGDSIMAKLERLMLFCPFVHLSVAWEHLQCRDTDKVPRTEAVTETEKLSRSCLVSGTLHSWQMQSSGSTGLGMPSGRRGEMAAPAWGKIRGGGGRER
jgi:hypothetical protein